MSGLTILAHTTCAVLVAGVDLIPPVALWVTRQPAGQVDLGETVNLKVYLLESQTVARVQGRILQLPERTEVARVPFSLPQDAETAFLVERARWPFRGSWTVDHAGDFLLEIIAEDDSGNRSTTSVFPGNQQCLITTRAIVPTASILFYGHRTSPIFHDEVYLEILGRNGISFDLWNLDLRGANGAIWLEYSGPDQAVVLLPGNMDVHSYNDIHNLAEAGGNLFIPAGLGGSIDSVFTLEPGHTDLMRDYLFSTLEPYAAASARQSPSVHGTQDYPLFEGLDVVVDQGLSSAIVPAPGVGPGIADPLLVDAAGGVQAIRVRDRGVMSIYLNFPLAMVADQRMREELFLRSLEDLLGVDLPRASITAVLETPATPAAFALEQNYPNPFNAATLIRYRLERTGPVRLSVLDVAGQEVCRLVDGVQLAGPHEVRWDGAGRASGVYLYKLEGGPYAETRRMLLLK